MKLTASAIISQEKIKNYLLSKRKRNDKSKWLLKAGYKPEDWQRLEIDLRNQILNLNATITNKTTYGDMFEISGTLKGPNGKYLEVCTIWMIEYESQLTKFVTMYPNKK